MNLTAFPIRYIKNIKLGFGNKITDLEYKFKNISYNKYNITTNSGSAAAFLIFQYLYKIKGICNVFIPSLSFTSIAWAAIQVGHNIVLIDVDDNLLFDFDSYHQKQVSNDYENIIVFLPYGGLSKHDYLSNLKGNETIIIDAAHCIFFEGNYDYKFYSFYPTKPICAIQGGMLCTDNIEANEFFRLAKNFGRKQDGPDYNIVESGFKFYMDNFNASLVYKNMDDAVLNSTKRKKNLHFVLDNINKKVLCHDAKSSHYLCTIILDKPMSKEIRKKYPFFTFHYPYLHQMTYYKTVLSNQNQVMKFPNLEILNNRILNVPIHEDLKQEELKYICQLLQ